MLRPVPSRRTTRAEMAGPMPEVFGAGTSVRAVVERVVMVTSVSWSQAGRGGLSARLTATFRARRPGRPGRAVTPGVPSFARPRRAAVPATRDPGPVTAGLAAGHHRRVLVRAEEERAGWTGVAAATAVVLLTLALGTAALALGAAAPAAVAHELGLNLDPFGAVTALVLAVAGAVLLVGSPRSVLGWVLGAAGVVWAFDTVCASWAAYAAASTPMLPGAAFALWFTNRIGAVLLLPFPLVLGLYPDGRLPEGRWRRPVAAGLVATAALPVVLAVVPSSVADDRYGTGSALLRELALDPLTLPLPDPVARALLLVTLPCAAAGIVVVAASVVARWRHAHGVERQRLGWLLWAALVDVLVIAVGLVVPTLGGGVGLTLAALVTGAAVVVGVRTPRLVDVDALLGGTLVYAALGALVVVLDAAVVAVAGATLGDRVTQRGAVLALLLGAALVYLPLRAWLWRGVRRLVLGERDRPYQVLSALAARLETASGPQEALLEVAAAVATAFRVPYVAVEVDAGGEQIVAEYGTPVGEAQSLPISYGGAVVGRLRLPRTGLRARLSRPGRAAARRRRPPGGGRGPHQPARRRAPAQPGARWSAPARRSAAGSAGTCTTASARRSAGSALRIDTAPQPARPRPGRADDVLRQAREDVRDGARRRTASRARPAAAGPGRRRPDRRPRQQAERLRDPGPGRPGRGRRPAGPARRRRGGGVPDRVRGAGQRRRGTRGGVAAGAVRRRRRRCSSTVADDGAGIDAGPARRRRAALDA